VLTVQAAQGVTSTEHILAMPAGSRAVDAFTAYAGGSRHRRASWLVTSDGAERREVAGRRPLGDARPVREADVWANVARNLARQAEAPSALGFLERAQLVHQGAADALQRGLQPLEQREADRQARTTLGRTFWRRRVAAQIARLVEPLRGLAEGQAERLAALNQTMSATWRAFAEIGPEIQSTIRQVAARLEHQKVAQRKAADALEAARLGSAREFLSALTHDPALGRVVAESRGPELAAQRLAAMDRERQAQLDPNVRAERLAALERTRTGL
jgi:hypothetical protein